MEEICDQIVILDGGKIIDSFDNHQRNKQLMEHYALKIGLRYDTTYQD
ncbi:hypothetical protein GCM10010965_32150 [Caldalkalibacillus thermarum]|nr:hypothetical protein GCM10010965_32150 [Caldalkalibacillus thermarum]